MFLAGSCIKYDEPAIRESDSITFITYLQQDRAQGTKSFSSHITGESADWSLELKTKASLVSKLEGAAYVLGYTYDESIATDQEPWDMLADAGYYFNGDELKASTSVRWGLINTDKIKIYVYTPVSIDGATVSTAGGPVISYTLPPYRNTDGTPGQTDIITAVKDVSEQEFGKTVPLTFNHALTALKFRMGFPCTVKSITISGVYNKADYTIGSGWSNHSVAEGGTYTVDFGTAGKAVAADEELITDSDVLMMIPQTLPFGNTDNPLIQVTYNDGTGDKTISSSLKRLKWEEGKLITYTIHKKASLEYIYFDLNAGCVTIQKGKYTGYVYKNNGKDLHTVTGDHQSGNNYYVYQSTNAAKHGWSGEPEAEGSTFSIPDYPLVTLDGGKTLWSDFITNNRNVEQVIKAWDDSLGAGKTNGKNGNEPLYSIQPNTQGAKGAVRDAGREVTKNYIYVKGNLGDVNMVIDNIYSSYQQPYVPARSKGSITFLPSENGNTTLVLNMIGDSRLGCIHYTNTNEGYNNGLVFEGTGSLTVADADYYRVKNNFGYEGYYSNRGCSVIGSNDNSDHAYNITINSGVIFSGATKAEYCTAIGGGGNGNSRVTINGGIVSAVASGTGTAIGGGTGVQSQGGKGEVIINNGNVYAYNHANCLNIPTSAIGGAGSEQKEGNVGHITINGGNIYAESGLGTAIGGGSSATKKGGTAYVYINDGIVVAKSLANSSGIGGGSSYTSKSSSSALNGGDAIIKIGITGKKPIVRTGSIGGGFTGAAKGKIGYADVEIHNGDIQAQFVMAASDNNRFYMKGGIIRNSYHTDNDYIHIQENGGAVYMEQGTFLMKGGDIMNCTGQNGGAVYIKGTDATTFTMNGGSISNSIADNNGGALYLEGGKVTLNGGTIKGNLAEKGNGGGVCIVGGNFDMPSGSTATIEGNAANSYNTSNCGKGGGVYVSSASSDVTVDILSGSIKGNSSDRYGGGLCVDMGTAASIAANVTVGEAAQAISSNPLVQGNKTFLEGGGLYVNGAKANITINNGEISGNYTAGYVANADVANEGGMVTLNGGNVNSVTVTYMPNGGSVSLDGASVESVSQKIVTATNSKMAVPGEFSRAGWRISRWHTRPDGDDTKGTAYATGATLNLNANVTLYAQWEPTT